MNLADIFSAIDSAKRKFSDTASAPVGNLQQLIGSVQDAWRNLRSQPVPQTLQPSEKELGTALEAVMNFAPGGMLRLGGRPDLMPVHSTSETGFERMLESQGRKYGGVAEMYAPSIAIQKGGLQTTFGDVLMIPKVGAFDPQAFPSTLFNRDAYTPRRNDFPGQPIKSMADADFSKGSYKYRAMAEDRLLDRFMDNPEGYRMTEGLGVGNKSFGASLGVSGDHADAMMASPHFRSFARYEKDPRGADVLRDVGTPAGLDNEHIHAAVKLYDDAKSELLYSKDANGRFFHKDPVFSEAAMNNGFIQAVRDNPGFLKAFPELAKKYGEYRKAMEQLPTNYAELKMTGPVPITQEHWAGIILPQKRYGGSNEEIRGYAKRQNIPTYDYKPLNLTATDEDMARHYRELFDIADTLQKVSGPTRQQPIFPGRDFPSHSVMPKAPAQAQEAKTQFRFSPVTDFSGGGWPSKEMFETWQKNGLQLFAESQGSKYPILDYFDMFLWDLPALKVAY